MLRSGIRVAGNGHDLQTSDPLYAIACGDGANTSSQCAHGTSKWLIGNLNQRMSAIAIPCAFAQVCESANSGTEK
jgi:hypothetical protein